MAYLSLALRVVSNYFTRVGKGKEVPRPGVAQRVPGGFRPPDFHDIRHMKVVRSSAPRTGRLYHQGCSWYSFSLGAESTPGPW